MSVEEVELAELLDACVDGLGLALDYDRSLVQGKVSVRSEAGYTSEGIWALANRQLAARKLAVVQPSGEDALAVVPVADAAKVARVEMDVRSARAGFVKTVKGLHYADAERVVEPLRAVLSGEGVLLQPIKDARQVLLAGPKAQVLEALDLLELIDSPVPPMVAAYPVLHSTPTAVVALIERVTKAMEQVGKYKPEGVALAEPTSGTILVVAPEPEHFWWQEEIRRFDQVRPGITREYVPRRFGLAETAKLVEEVARGPVESSPGWRMVQDELTGTLVVTAQIEQHAEVERVLARLESEPADSRLALRAFPVKHRDVDEFLGLLESLLQGTPLPDATTGAAGEEKAALPAAPTSGGTGGRPVPEASALSLSKDSGTNRILAIGPPRLLDELGRLRPSLSYLWKACGAVGFVCKSKLYEAAGEFEWARKLLPGHPDPRLNLALTLEQAGKTDEAIATYKTALEVWPGHIATVQALARLCVVQHRGSDELAGWLDQVGMQGETEGWREWARGTVAKRSRP